MLAFGHVLAFTWQSCGPYRELSSAPPARSCGESIAVPHRSTSKQLSLAEINFPQSDLRRRRDAMFNTAKGEVAVKGT